MKLTEDEKNILKCSNTAKKLVQYDSDKLEQFLDVSYPDRNKYKYEITDERYIDAQNEEREELNQKTPINDQIFPLLVNIPEIQKLNIDVDKILNQEQVNFIKSDDCKNDFDPLIQLELTEDIYAFSFL